MSTKETNTNNTLLRVLLAVLVVILLCGVFCGAAGAADASGLPTSGDLSSTTYTLTDDVQLAGELKIPSGVAATIDLNGHTITAALGNRVITVEGNLELTDTSSGKTGKITGGSANLGGGVYVNGGTFEMKGGNIVGNKAILNDYMIRYGGGGVYVEKGTFKMNSGSIESNAAKPHGGGVYVATGGTFEMNSGSITGNTASTTGGGVYVSGRFKMEGGSIGSNTAEIGSGVHVDHVDSDALFEMSGGSITTNIATDEENGSGVQVNCDATFQVTGSASVMNNSNKNVFLRGKLIEQDTPGKLILTGNLTGTVLVTPGYEGSFGTASGTVSGANHIINEKNSRYAEVKGNTLDWSDSAFSGTLITLDWNNESRKTGKTAAFRNKTTSFPIAAPAKTGCEFTGWHLQDGTLLIKPDGTLVSGVNSYTDASGKWICEQTTLTLSAGWEQVATELTLNADEGDPKLQNVSVSKGSSDIVTFIKPRKAHHVFTGWYLQQSSTTPLINPDGTLVSGVNSYTSSDGKWICEQTTLTLSAGWKVTETNITLNVNGGTPGIEYVVTAIRDTTTKFEDLTPVKKGGVECTGWYLTAADKTKVKVIKRDGTLMKNVTVDGINYTNKNGVWICDKAALTLNAEWITTVTYHADEEENKTQTYPLWQTFELPVNPEKEGDTFLGWRIGSQTGDYFTLCQNETNVYLFPSAHYDTNKKWKSEAETLDLYAAWSGTAPAETYTLSTSTIGQGSIDGTPEGGQVAPRDSVSLRAQPSAGYCFKQWVTAGLSSPTSAANPLTFSMPAKDVSVVAVFEMDSPGPSPSVHNVSVQSSEGGNAYASASVAASGETITITAAPGDGYRFKEWTVVSPAGLTITGNTFTMPDADVSIKAVFEIISKTIQAPGGTAEIDTPAVPFSDGGGAFVMSATNIDESLTYTAKVEGTIPPKRDGYSREVICVVDVTATLKDRGQPSLFTAMVTLRSEDCRDYVCLEHFTNGTWTRIFPTVNGGETLGYHTFLYSFNLPSYCPLAIVVETPDATPVPTKSSTPSGTSTWLMETTTPTPTPTPTVTQTPEVPQVKPVASKTPTGKSPVPFTGIIAGLGAVLAVFAVRRRK